MGFEKDSAISSSKKNHLLPLWYVFKDDEEVIDKANKLMSSVSSDMPPPSGRVSTVRNELALACAERSHWVTKTVFNFQPFNYQRRIYAYSDAVLFVPLVSSSI